MPTLLVVISPLSPMEGFLSHGEALNEPESEESSSDTHSEICSPAQLRQQTEELCAAIDEVLQEPLSKQQHDSSPSSLQKLLISDVGKTPITLQRPAGRETRFANLNLRTPTVNESKKTRPGVIRPTTVKAKIIFKKEDPIQPNPFKKYLEETTESQTEQVISHADLLTPGPFSHLGSIFAETYDNSYSPYRHNTLYNKAEISQLPKASHWMSRYGKGFEIVSLITEVTDVTVNPGIQPQNSKGFAVP
uniref:Uncharacterized protein n=1 Tax=Sphaerodactylus townsendi TaxID=933632 RepID=A0ACB8GD98_9SAUR